MTPSSPAKIGTFLGVFTPTVLTILGVILFLRTGWLVGHQGLLPSLLIVVIAHAITIITTLSFSSVATNTEVQTGGAYYIISRSLGVEIGGAVGLPLFLSQVFSVTLYAFGLAESLRLLWPGVPTQEAAFLIVLGVGLLALPGAQWALKTQLPIMALVALALAALAVGALTDGTTARLSTSLPSEQVGFWVGFAVFFPAVTGVMAGLGLSGDLRDPGRAIPVGSMGAVLVGFAVYLAVPVLLLSGATQEALQQDTMVWSRISPLGAWVILPGLWGAIFSSALGSILGAPRTLQALARDRLAPRLFGRRDEGWKALAPGMVISLAVALGAVMLGKLDAIAPVVTMFFLTVYGTVNLVAALEALSGDPSWRPGLRAPWPVALAGALGCLAVMLLISPLASLAAIVVELAIWLYLSRRERSARWGDARRGIYESLIRWSLVRLKEHPMTPRNWRPHILVFVPDPVTHLDLIRFGYWFSQGRGVVTVCELEEGDLLGNELDIPAREGKMQQVLDRERLVVFSEVNVVQEVEQGIVNVSQANGMAGMESNTILLGWPNDLQRRAAFLRVMAHLERLNKSFILSRIRPRYLFPREGITRTIDIWWGGLQRNGDLMMLLAYLLTRNSPWQDARVRVLSVAADEQEQRKTARHLDALITEIRIEATPRVVLREEGCPVIEMIHQESAEADVVFFGLAAPVAGEEEAYAERLEQLAGDLPNVFFVRNQNIFVGELLNPSDDPLET